MTARAGLLVASLCAAGGCRFDTRGLPPPGDGPGDAPSLDAPREALLEFPDGPTGERQDREQSCLDGRDNDGDGSIDCADPDCSADHECVPVAPVSMSGYYHLRKGSWEDAAPPCADGANAGIYGLGPAAPSCAPCQCGALAGAACGYPPISHWKGGSEDCQSGTVSDATPTLGKPGCTIGTGSGTNALKIVGAAPLTSAGSCPPSGGGLETVKPWLGQLEVCAEAGVGGGCPSGVCVRRPAAGYDAKICHRLGGGGDCGSWETVVGHADWQDGRACTACGCTPGGTKCTGGSYTLYGDNQSCDSGGCNTPEKIEPDGKCHKLSPGGISYPYSVEAKPASPSGGSCTPTGGQPVGAIQSKPITFCCR